MSEVPSEYLICKIDGKVHKDIASLHAFLKRFKISQKKYYEEYWPRFDKFTNERIEYTAFDKYIKQEFNSRDNLKNWLLKNKFEGKTWAENWLKDRIKDKQLLYLPTTVELRSLNIAPSIHYFEAFFSDIGGYEGLGNKLGVQTGHKLNSVLEFAKLPISAKIIQDTREQCPITLPYVTEIKKLNVGDYGLEKQYDNGVYIERKSLNDFCGTMGKKGFDRFCRELDRAVKSNSYVIMLVEVSIEHALTFNQYYDNRHIQASPTYIFKQLREILAKYPKNFQVAFVKNRQDMVKKIVKIFELGEIVKTTDIQYKIEIGEL